MTRPDWTTLYTIAAAQEGYFTTKQAATAGYSVPLLCHHVSSGLVAHVRRGIYRLVHFPAGEEEDLVVAWLWSEGKGVVSHDTALALHNLSDLLPSHIHLTLPAIWRRRRFRVPPGLRLHCQDVPPFEITWHGAVPVTAPLRTIRDCFLEHLPPDLLAQGVRDGLARGLFAAADIASLQEPG
jgi:predicted transcriptional regulator of viral defense system